MTDHVVLDLLSIVQVLLIHLQQRLEALKSSS